MSELSPEALNKKAVALARYLDSFVFTDDELERERQEALRAVNKFLEGRQASLGSKFSIWRRLDTLARMPIPPYVRVEVTEYVLAFQGEW